jgi:hypothetical protein
VAFIDESNCVVLFGELDNLWQWCDVSIHGEDSIGDNHSDSLVLCFYEDLFKVLHVQMVVSVSLGLAKSNSINDTCMVQGVADYCIFGCQKSFKDSSVSVKTTGKKDAIVLFLESSDSLLKLEMLVLSSAYKSDTCHSKTVGVNGVFCCLRDPRVICKTQVVVSTEVQNLFTVCLDAHALWVLDHSLNFESPRRFCFVKNCMTGLDQCRKAFSLRFDVHF